MLKVSMMHLSFQFVLQRIVASAGKTKPGVCHGRAFGRHLLN